MRPQRQQQTGNRQKLANYLQTPSGKKQLDKYAPDGVTEGEVKRIALWVVEEGADGLDKCTPGSIVAGVLQSLHEGLDLTTDDAYLIPYGTKADYRRGYQGLIKLAERPDDVRKVDASLICENDDFQRWRDDEGIHVKHKFADPNRGDDVGVYCVIHGTGGLLKKVEVLDKDDIRKVRNAADDGSFGWNGWEGEMKKKAAVRRACKWVDTPPAIPDPSRGMRQKQIEAQADNVEQLPGTQNASGGQSVIEQQAKPKPKALESGQSATAQQHDQSQRQEPTVHEGAQQQMAEADKQHRQAGGETDKQTDKPDLGSLHSSYGQLLRSDTTGLDPEHRAEYETKLKQLDVWGDREAMAHEIKKLRGKSTDERAEYVRQSLGVNPPEQPEGDDWTLDEFRDAHQQSAKVVDKLESYTEPDAEIRACLEYFADRKDTTVMGLPGTKTLDELKSMAPAKLTKFVEQAAGEIPDFDDPTS